MTSNCIGRLSLYAAAAALWWSAPAAASPQDDLPILVNDGFVAPNALRFDWPLLSIGTGQYESGPTGVTVFRFGRKVAAAVDIRGGGPGTVNAAYLQLGYRIPEVDAVVLSGGSWYGLETVTAVNTALKDDGVRGGAWDNVGLAVGSIIYDFGGRRLNEIYPDKRLAQAALRAARTGSFPIGAYGAGRSAMSGSLFGCNAHSGQGAAYRKTGDLKVAVFTVVNALGVITDRHGRVAACHRAAGWPQDLKAADLMSAAPQSLQPNWAGPAPSAPERRNTTISLVVTNQTMEPAELQRVAAQVHTSMARAIQPFATELDGDVLYAVSTGELPAAVEPLVSIRVATIASDLMWDAVLSSVPPQPTLSRPPNAGVGGSFSHLAGEYRFSQLASLLIIDKDGRLFARASGPRPIFGIGEKAPVRLTWMGGSDFTVTGRYPLTIRFSPGRITLNPGRWEQAADRLTTAR